MTTRPPLWTRSFLLLWLFAFVAFGSAFQLFPTIPFRILDLGGTKAHAGWFLAVYTYASAFAAPLTGSVADRIGRARLVVIASVLFIGFSLLYAVVERLPLLLIVGVAHGAAWSGILSASGAMISEIIPASRRTEGLAYYGMAGTSAVAVAPTVGLALYRVDWLAVCLSMAVLSIVMMLIVRRVDLPSSGPPSPLRLATLVDWQAMLVSMTLFSVSFGYGGITSYIALLSIERGVFPESLFFIVFAVTILLMRVFVARVGDRFGPIHLLLPSLALMPVALLIVAYGMTRGAIVLAAILFGAGLGGGYPAFITFVLGRTDPARRGATFGAILWAFDIGIGTGSLAIGIVAERAGFTVAFIIPAIVAAFAIPIFFGTSRLLKTV